MADTTTTNLLLTKPEVGASTDTWGTKINTDLDSVDAIFAADGTGTSVGLNVGSGKSLKLVGDVIDTNGNELLKVTATASAVNELTLANAATGGAPTFTASGGDTNIGMKLVGKGTGEVTARVNGSDVFNASSNFGFKNRIINGAQVINQRGATVTAASTYVTDRWQVDNLTTSGAVSFAQNSTAPAGFTNSLKITVTTADAAVAASDIVEFRQWIEGYNTADFSFGSASAGTFTISFWVNSSVTGTYGVSFRNSAADRVYVSTYTVNAANTWEQKTITVAGDTTGTWLTDNGRGLGIAFCVMGGSNFQGTANAWGATNNRTTSAQANLLATINNTFYITGVQLEKGSTATSFDYRPYGTELALCQRYYYRLQAAANNQDFGPACAVTTTVGRVSMPFPVTMRNAPSAVEQSGTASNYQCRFANNNTSCSAVPTFSTASVAGSAVNFTVASGLTAGQGGQFGAGPSTGASAFLAWSAEL